MDGASEAPSGTVQYVTYQVPTPPPQLIYAPTTQEARVKLFRHSPTADLIKYSFGAALVFGALLFACFAFAVISKLSEEEEIKVSSSHSNVRTSWHFLAAYFAFNIVQFFAYSPALYAVIMIGRKKPNTIRILVWLSLSILIVAVGFDLWVIYGPGEGELLEGIFLFILACHSILIGETIVFLCKLSDIFQKNEVQVQPETQANVNPVTSMDAVENQSN